MLSTHYMEEAEKLCDRLIIMDQGKILTEGTPSQLVEESVSKFVLEIHGADASDLPDLSPKVTVQTHGSTRYYFAPSAELLTPLIDQHPSHKSLLRPSNLEDVFLRLTGQDRLQVVLLWNDSHDGLDLLRVLEHVPLLYRETSPRKRGATIDHPHGRRFARSIGSQQAECFPFLDGEIDLIDGGE